MINTYDNINRRSMIMTTQELEFTIFCIESVAQEQKTDAKVIYQALTQKSNLLYDYVIPCYDSLHTQSKEYIVDDLIHIMQERGVL